MIQYPDLDKPAIEIQIQQIVQSLIKVEYPIAIISKNVNYQVILPLTKMFKQYRLDNQYSQQELNQYYCNNQVNWAQQGNIPQYIPAIPITQYPSSLQQKNFGELDKENLPPYSLSVRCPECGGMIQTKLNYVPGCLSFSLCLTMCAFGLFCGCCLIPFCMNCCKRQVHQCPLCEKVLGEVK